MTRILILGATGTVGRELVGLLAPREDLELVVTGRNRVLLDHLEATLGVQVQRFDSTGMSASALPAADVMVDLTFSLNRHPRWVTRTAERSVEMLLGYLRLHPQARVVHTGTFALLNERPEWADELCPRLLWSGPYMLSKSAAERALRRAGAGERLSVIRLGNMAVPDMTWSASILRAVRDGAVSDPDLLDRPANLSDARQLARAVLEPRPGLSYVPEMAGFTWGEVIDAVAAATGQPPLDRAPGAEAGHPASGPRLPVGALVRRALYVAPLSAASGPLEGLPGATRWLSAGRDMVRRTRPAAASFPAALPGGDYPMPGAARDPRCLEALVQDLSGLFDRRGWAPL